MSNLARINNITDFRNAARRKLPRRIFDYADGGADDETTLLNNMTAFGHYMLVPHVRNTRSEVDCALDFIGCPLALPIMLSPVGGIAMFHPEKEYAVIRAASKHRLMFTLSIVGTVSIEDAASAGSGPKMFQVYLQKDKGATAALVERCKESGFDALCITIDASVAGNRERDIRNSFGFSHKKSFSAFLDFASRPSWSFGMLSAPPLIFPNLNSKNGAAVDTTTVSEIIQSEFKQDIVWDDIAWLAKIWGGPLIVKGILNPDDALQAIQSGAEAVMLSNHGGRQLDGVSAPVDIVEEVRQRLGSGKNLILDGGVRRGNQVLKAIALGANACSFGRPYLYALAAGGENGVCRLFDLMTAEIKRSMALLGCANLAEIESRHIRTQRASPPSPTIGL